VGATRFDTGSILGAEVTAGPAMDGSLICSNAGADSPVAVPTASKPAADHTSVRVRICMMISWIPTTERLPADRLPAR
jgi:hypothetical protein